MIKHIVMFKYLDEANGKTWLENATEIKAMMEALPTQIPQLRSLEVGLESTGNANNHSLVLTTTFDNVEDLRTYTNHPAHVAMGNIQRNYTVPGSRSCVDYEG